MTIAGVIEVDVAPSLTTFDARLQAGLSEATEKVAAANGATFDSLGIQAQGAADKIGVAMTAVANRSSATASSVGDTVSAVVAQTVTAASDTVGAAGRAVDTAATLYGAATDRMGAANELLVGSATATSKAVSGSLGGLGTTATGISDALDAVAQHADQITVAFAASMDKLTATAIAAAAKIEASLSGVVGATDAASRGVAGAGAIGAGAAASAGVSNAATSTAAGVAGSLGLAANTAQVADVSVQHFAEGISEGLKKLGDMVATVVPFMGGAFIGMAKKIDDAEIKGSGFLTSLQQLGKLASVALVAGAAIAAGAAIKMAESFQQGTANLSAQAGITKVAAQGIGAAFLDTAGKTTFSAQSMVTAYAPVATQLSTVAGHALDATSATKFMAAAMDLAEGSGSALNSTTSALATVLQTYGLGVGDAAGASNVLFNAAQLTGTSIGTVASVVDKLKTKLGDAAPTLADTGSLMADLAEHGIVGARGITTVATSISSLIDPSAKMQATLDTLGIHLINANGQFIGMGPALASIKTALDALPVANNAAADAAQILANKTTLARLALETQTPAVKAQILALKDQDLALASGASAMDQAQAAQALFGKNAGALIPVIQGGAAAFDKARDAVDKSGSAQEAAEKQSATFKGTLDKLSAAGEDLGVKLGLILLPKLAALGQELADGVNWLTRHRDAAIALGIIIGGPLVAAMGAFAAAAVLDSLSGLVLGFEQLTGATLAADAAMDANPIGAVILAVGILSVSIYELVAHWHEVTQAVKDFVEQHKILVAILAIPFAPIIATIGLVVAGIKYWRDITQWFADGWNDTWAVVAQVINSAWGVIDAVFQALRTVVNNVLIPAFHIMQSVVTAVWSVISSVIRAAWGIIKPVFDAVVTMVRDVLVVVWDVLKVAVEVAWALITDTILASWIAIKAIFDLVKAYVRDILAPVFTWLWQNVIQPTFQGIGANATSMWNGILKPIFDTMVSYFTGVLEPTFLFLWHGVVEPVWAGITLVISAAWSGIKSTFDTLVAFVENDIPGAFTTARAAISGVWTGIQNDATAAWAVIETIFKTPLNIIIEGLDDLITGINAISGLVGNQSAIPKIAKLASGGYITNGPALVGEGDQRYPEVVVATDPAYRARNVELAKVAARAVGLPMLAGGGIVGDITGAIGSVAGAVGSVASDAVSFAGGLASQAASLIASGAVDLVLDPIFAVVNAISGIASAVPSVNPIKAIEAMIKSWVSGPVESKLQQEQATAGPTGGSGGYSSLTSWLGVPYLWGGGHGVSEAVARRLGVDCSGLVDQVFGYTGTTYEQVKLGTAVASLADALPSDLAFFSSLAAGEDHHVGIITAPGGTQMIDAPHTGTVVRYDNPASFGTATVRRIMSAAAAAGANAPNLDNSGPIANPQAAASALLTYLGDPQTPASVSTLATWAEREGGMWHNNAMYNPWNTTMREPGSTSINSIGVQSYGSWNQGLAATAETLRNGQYPQILADLASGAGLSRIDDPNLDKWGTGSIFDQGGVVPPGASIMLNNTGSNEQLRVITPDGAGAGTNKVEINVAAGAVTVSLVAPGGGDAGVSTAQLRLMVEDAFTDMLEDLGQLVTAGNPGGVPRS